MEVLENFGLAEIHRDSDDASTNIHSLAQKKAAFDNVRHAIQRRLSKAAMLTYLGVYAEVYCGTSVGVTCVISRYPQ